MKKTITPFTRARRDSTQPTEAPTTLQRAPGNFSDSEAGEQLTAQYRRAVSGMREVLIFGAMLMQIETHVTVSTRGHGGKFGNKGSGLKGWLTEHAPEITRSTAYRFLGITKEIATEYRTIVGPRIAKNYDLPSLVLAESEKLPAPAKAKQLELFDYVSGTSQRSWLDRFKPPPEIAIGGDTRKIDPATGQRINHQTPSPEEIIETQRRLANEDADDLLRKCDILFEDNIHTLIEHDKRLLLIACLGETKRKLEAIK